jgi:hypothetical protein
MPPATDAAAVAMEVQDNPPGFLSCILFEPKSMEPAIFGAGYEYLFIWSLKSKCVALGQSFGAEDEIFLNYACEEVANYQRGQ